MTSIFQVLKDYSQYFETDYIPDYDFLKLSNTHRKFDALMRRFWDSFHPLTRDIFLSFIYEVSRLLNTVEELNKEVSIKEREVQKISKELNERREYIASLLEKLEQEVTTQLSLTEEEIRALEEESKAKSELVEKLQQEIMTLKSELNSQSTLSSDAVTEAVLMDQKINKMEAEIKEQQEVIEKLTFDNLQLMEQNLSLQKDNEALVKQVNELENKLTQLTTANEMLQKELSQKEQAINSLNKKVIEMKAGEFSGTSEEETSDSFDSFIGSDVKELKKDMMALTKIISEEFSQPMEHPVDASKMDELSKIMNFKSKLIDFYENIKSKDPTLDLFLLNEEIEEMAKEDPYGVLNVIEKIISVFLTLMMDTKLEEIKREFLIEKIQLQSEIVQLRNKIIELTDSLEEPLKIKKEVDEMFETSRGSLKEKEMGKVQVDEESKDHLGNKIQEDDKDKLDTITDKLDAITQDDEIIVAKTNENDFRRQPMSQPLDEEQNDFMIHHEYAENKEEVENDGLQPEERKTENKQHFSSNFLLSKLKKHLEEETHSTIASSEHEINDLDSKTLPQEPIDEMPINNDANFDAVAMDKELGMDDNEIDDITFDGMLVDEEPIDEPNNLSSQVNIEESESSQFDTNDQKELSINETVVADETGSEKKDHQDAFLPVPPLKDSLLEFVSKVKTEKTSNKPTLDHSDHDLETSFPEKKEELNTDSFLQNEETQNDKVNSLLNKFQKKLTSSKKSWLDDDQ